MLQNNVAYADFVIGADELREEADALSAPAMTLPARWPASVDTAAARSSGSVGPTMGFRYSSARSRITTGDTNAH